MKMTQGISLRKQLIPILWFSYSSCEELFLYLFGYVLGFFLRFIEELPKHRSSFFNERQRSFMLSISASFRNFSVLGAGLSLN
jgi:hypothetical protein